MIPPEQEFRAPVTAWLAAIGSYLFVGVGMTIVGVACARWFFSREPLLAFGLLTLLTLVLGSVSARQAFRASRTKAYKRLVEEQLADRPQSPIVAYLIGLIGGGVALGLTMWFNGRPEDRGYIAFAGTMAGATLGGLLVRSFVGTRPERCLMLSTCNECGEQLVGPVTTCPVCGAAISKGT